jgi:hypothetical protein
MTLIYISIGIAIYITLIILCLIPFHVGKRGDDNKR